MKLGPTHITGQCVSGRYLGAVRNRPEASSQTTTCAKPTPEIGQRGSATPSVLAFAYITGQGRHPMRDVTFDGQGCRDFRCPNCEGQRTQMLQLPGLASNSCPDTPTTRFAGLKRPPTLARPTHCQRHRISHTSPMLWSRVAGSRRSAASLLKSVSLPFTKAGRAEIGLVIVHSLLRSDPRHSSRYPRG